MRQRGGIAGGQSMLAARADQLVLPLGKPKAAREVETVSVGRRLVSVRVVRHPRSRRYVIRVLPDGTVRLTLPRGGSRAAALAFLRRELNWVEGQRYSAARNAAHILVRGVALRLETEADEPGRAGRRLVRFGAEAVARRAGESARAAASRRLREIAAGELKPRLLAMADRLQMFVRRVTIRSQQTRWGSCSPEGAIALNWRLVQMPDFVRDYILIHELMHLRERNHSRRFWTLVERACPDHRAARKWLKVHEGELT